MSLEVKSQKQILWVGFRPLCSGNLVYNSEYRTKKKNRFDPDRLSKVILTVKYRCPILTNFIVELLLRFPFRRLNISHGTS